LKKILSLTTTYPEDENDVQPRFVHCLNVELNRSLNVEVLTPAISGRGGLKKIQEGYEVNRFRYSFSCFERLCGGDGVLENLKRKRWLYCIVPFFLLAYFINIVKVIRSKKIDVIHAHWIIPQGFLALLSVCFVKHPPKILVTSHGGDLYALNSPIMNMLKKYVLNRVEHITVVSTAMKSYCCKEFDINPNKVSVISMGVDLRSSFIPAGIKNKNRLVFVGRLAEKKGLGILLKAISLMKQKDDIFLDIIGGGSALESYKKMASELGIDHKVCFYGSLENTHVIPLLQRAEIAVFPFVIAENGDQEGLGLTMVEAMGCECITAASELGAIKDVIEHEQTGYLVKPGDPDCLANLLDSLVLDMPNKETLRKKGRAFVLTHFDWSTIGVRYAALINSFK
jgi:glycosyltransferase involved in cell wall biosynthesis